MNVKPLLIVNTVLILAMLGLSLWAWPLIAADARLPVHFNLEGVADRFGSKEEALLALPLVAGALTLVFLVLPYLDPRRKNLERSAKLWNAAAIGVTLVVAALHVFLVLTALGHDLAVGNFVLPGIAGLFMLLGNYLGKSRSNWFAGVRTPWTMSSEYAWEKTHRWAGRLFVLTGVLTLAAWLFTTQQVAVYVMIAAIAATSLTSIVLSYIFWRNDPDRAEVNRGA
jgi:uncharacterized membrane protein